ELAGVIPAFGGSGRAAPGVLADERYRAHRAIRRLLELLAADRPLVIVLDDLHWADEASIELVGALLRRGPDAPCLLGIAFRPGQAPARLSAALAAPAVSRIGLAELSEAEAVELLGELDAQRAATIYRHGGGNPFYLEQLARTDDARSSGVPTTVAASLAEELAGLSAAERALLESAAVAGDPFQPELAAAIPR